MSAKPHEETGCGCPEYAASLSRRSLFRMAMGVGVGFTGLATFGDAFVSAAFAANAPTDGVLVVLSMRGAIDGMSLVVPHGDPVYYRARPRIAIPAERLIAADGFFGLHPRMAPLLPWWTSGKMAAVHATGFAVRNRSHFAAMEELEEADPGSSARIGWLNRLVGCDTDTNPLQAIQYGSSTPPTELAGPQPTVSINSIDEMRLSGDDQWDIRGGRPKSIRTLWGSAPGPLGVGARTALRALTGFAPVRTTPATPQNGAVYPGNSDLAKALACAARTIRANVGAKVIAVDHGSWDHHLNLGTLEWGSMQSMVGEFATSLAAFFTDLGTLADKVTVVTISEFGRRTRENANYGLDHGYGNAMLLIGAGVRGGQYYGSWPGLTDTLDSDLLVTTDYRSVLAEVVAKRMGSSPATVFPRFTPRFVGALDTAPAAT